MSELLMEKQNGKKEHAELKIALEYVCVVTRK